jgi:ribonuclease Z
LLPREPARRPQLGYLYVPPFRVQGLSIAGEESCVQVPELNVTFDIGLSPRAALTSDYVALTHGHMDHAAGIAYYLSQRHFQGMGAGTIVCPPELEKPIHNVMRAWVDLESQRTPYSVIPLGEDQEHEIKPHTYLRAFRTVHTVPSVGFVVLERRSKLRPDLVGLPQERLVELKKRGEEITRLIEVPLVCYTGDTMWGPHFDRPDVLGAQVLITECTFVEDEHEDRASIGKHLHLTDVVRLVERSRAKAVVLTHMSRRTHLGRAVKQIEAALPVEQRGRVLVLMDRRSNQERFERQLREAGEFPGDAPEPQLGDAGGGEESV